MQTGRQMAKKWLSRFDGRVLKTLKPPALSCLSDQVPSTTAFQRRATTCVTSPEAAPTGASTAERPHCWTLRRKLGTASAPRYAGCDQRQTQSLASSLVLRAIRTIRIKPAWRVLSAPTVALYANFWGNVHSADSYHNAGLLAVRYCPKTCRFAHSAANVSYG